MRATFERRSARWDLCVLWLSVCALAACDHSSKFRRVAGDCEGEQCAGSAPPVAWNDPSPTYTAFVQVVDPNGAPIKGARVKVGDREKTTDDDGRVQVGPIGANKPEPIVVTKESATPYSSKTDAFKSGSQPERVVLMPVGKEQEFDTKQRAVVEHGGASIDLPPKGLVKSDGSRVSMAKAEMTQFSPDQTPEAAMPGSTTAYDPLGNPVLIQDILSVTYLHFSDGAGNDLNLAPGQTAILESPLPSGSSAKSGDQLTMWSLDEQKGAWREEKSCTVVEREGSSGKEKVCRGAVSHFSYWSIAGKQAYFSDFGMGCLNVVPKVDPGACFKVTIQSESLFACNAEGENCFQITPGFSKLLGDESGLVRQCSLVSLGKSRMLRVLSFVNVTTDSCGGSPAPQAGRHVMFSPPFSVTPTSDEGALVKAYGDSETTCPATCQAVSLDLTDTTAFGPTWFDRDNDGALFASDDIKEVAPWIPADCDDTNPRILPYAFENFCATQDMNCDGKLPEVKSLEELRPYAWNALCHMCKGVEAGPQPKPEKTGNLYDENCDGVVVDADGDGVKAPEDCNDWDKEVGPGKNEVPGNFSDEDCDGFWVDADGDGIPAQNHVFLAEKLKLPAASFTDCDDFDPNVNPTIDPALERGQLAAFFYDLGGTVRRDESFCSLFREGNFRETYFYQVRDLNCDGVVLDADGDAVERDCDDLDPRVGAPVASAGQQAPMCVLPMDLANDSVCATPTQKSGGCPAVTVSGTVVASTCEETKTQDGMGTGKGVCSFKGWWDADPLRITPGELWGPCDGVAGDPNNKLPSCPQGTTCGGVKGGSPWTADLDAHIRNFYAEGDELNFRGMCFPACTVN